MRLILLILLIPLIPKKGHASPAEEPSERSIPILDTTQELLGLRVNSVANRLDLFFADQRADDELARSRIRVRQQYEMRERSLPIENRQFRFNIRLPKLEERFHVDIFEKDEKKKKEIKKELVKRQVIANKLNTEWQFRADAGVNVSVPPKVFTRARLRKNFETGDVIHRFVEELSWYSDRDWEEFTTFDSDISLADDTLFRFRNTSDWKVTRKDFRTSHGPSILHRLSENDAIATLLALSTVVEDTWYVDNYRFSVNYRRNLYKQWLYLDFTPGIDFPKMWSFRRTPFLFTQLEILFGDY